MPGFYQDSFSEYLKRDINQIVGALTIGAQNAGFYSQLQKQTDVWQEQIVVIKSICEELIQCDKSIINSGIIFEYPIPRRGKRIDIVFIIKGLIFPIEFKYKYEKPEKTDLDQVEDYALDLRDFHIGSKNKKLFPILLSMETVRENYSLDLDKNKLVQKVQIANPQNCSRIILSILENFKTNIEIDISEWDNSLYNPTPTIIEAAQVLYAKQNVREISRSHANIKNLTDTFNAVGNAIDYAVKNNKKVICFITGIPGAGKTLAGLNIVHNNHNNNELGVFLSGNGPLVKVLQEALSRDHHERTNTPLRESRREVQTFVHNIHLFIDTYYNNEKKPPEKIIIFDEAQRAWDKKQSYRKFKRDISEPELLLQIMDRQNDWSVFIGLIGNGQEINDGEAGLPEWGRALSQNFGHWDIFISPQMISEGDYRLFENGKPESIKIRKVNELHLDIDIRSIRSEKIADWVEATLDNHPHLAQNIHSDYLADYPLYITRSLEEAKFFIKKKTRGLRKSGIIASSGARRLRPHGLDVTLDIDVPIWFLNPSHDIRSSNFLELPLTEFGIQGLELDWILMCWGADLRNKGGDWRFHRFAGTKWQNVHSLDKRRFILNKYRVLLTRAREGMVIWVPKGKEDDYTRNSQFYDSTYNYLIECGLKELDNIYNVAP